MSGLVALFKPYFEQLFDKDAQCTEIPNNKIRIILTNLESKIGLKTSQSIVLVFESYVIEDYKNAIKNSQFDILNQYGKSLRNIISSRMLDYDSDGDKNVAFMIYLDSRATDL